MEQMQIVFDPGMTFMANINVISFSQFKLFKSLLSAINAYPTHLSLKLKWGPRLKYNIMWSSYGSIKAVKQCLLKSSCIKCKVFILESWLNHQEVNVVLLFGLEGLGDDPGYILVLPTSQWNAIDLQDDLTHLQLVAVVSRASFLSTGIWGEWRREGRQ